MKKVIAFLILCATAFVCAQTSPTIGKPAPREHRGFYNSTSFSLAYNWFDNSREDIDKYSNSVKRDVDFFEYNGFSFSLVEFKFGLAFANFVAFHTVFNFGFFMGPLDYYEEEYRSVCTEDNVCVESRINEVDDPESSDAFGFRTFFGFGTTLYPFRDKNSPLNGLFFGSSFGYTLFVQYAEGGHHENTGNAGIGFQMELGKEWWINDHLSIGVGLGFAHSGLVWRTVSSHKSDNVLSLSFRLTRG